MQSSGNTVLITGGASGIGLALAKRFLALDNEVIICGRREEKLRQAKEEFPSLHTRVADIANANDREALVKWTLNHFGRLNILVNNAGIQNRIAIQKANFNWSEYQQEIAVNLEGPIHLTLLLMEHLQVMAQASIINISSGLAIVPATWAPIYSATKAALHSFSTSLRLQLEDTKIEVMEVLPPAVNTDLGGTGLHTFGAPLSEFADAVFARLLAGEQEIGYGGTEERLHLTKKEQDTAAKQMWENFKHHNR